MLIHAFKFGVEGGLLFEDAKEGAATATHGGIDGTKVVETLLHGTNLGMEGKDALLEVVDKVVTPCLDGLTNDIKAVLGGLAGMDA